MILDVQKVMLAAAEKKLGVTEVFKLAHIATATIMRIKKGKEIQTKTAGKLAEVLGVSVADLLKS